jgi:4-hydroxymandelate oxidase
MRTNQPLTIDNYEALARERLAAASFDYYAGGAGDELTLAANRTALDHLHLQTRVLVDVSSIAPATRVLRTDLSFPVMLAPTAFNKLAHPDGEVGAARAAGDAGTVMIASTFSTCSLEEIATAAAGPLWFQLYVYKDRAVTLDLVSRAEAAGYQAIVLNVDTPVLGRRFRDVRNDFALPERLTLRNFETPSTHARWKAASLSFAAWVHDLIDPSLTWDAVEWLRSNTRLPVILKGILAPDDGRRAVESGVDGIVVSNHGGRQLDGAVASIVALPQVADAVAGRVEVLMDGGIRRGSDVLKALALGARAVLIGRPYLWGLAVGGEAGVRDVLRILRSELELAMALTGRPSIESIDGTLIAPNVPRGAAV